MSRIERAAGLVRLAARFFFARPRARAAVPRVRPAGHLRTVVASAGALTILCLLLACQHRSGERDEPVATADSTADSVIVELRAPPSIARGEALPYTLHVRNVSGRPLQLSLLGREIAYDLIVRDSSGGLVWERLEGERVMAILRLESLGPGEALTREDRWDLRAADGSLAPAGDYTLQARVPTDAPRPFTSDIRRLRILPDR